MVKLKKEERTLTLVLPRIFLRREARNLRNLELTNASRLPGQPFPLFSEWTTGAIIRGFPPRGQETVSTKNAHLEILQQIQKYLNMKEKK
jgi:hypothetical protein